MENTLKKDGRTGPEYATLKEIAVRLKETGFAAFGGNQRFGIEEVVQATQDAQNYLTAVTVSRIRGRLGLPDEADPGGLDPAGAWQKAHAAIRKLNRLCAVLGLPDYLPEDAAAARRVLAERTGKMLQAMAESRWMSS